MSEQREAVLLEAARALCKYCAEGCELLYAVPDPRFGAWTHRRPVHRAANQFNHNKAFSYTVPVGCKAGAIHELRSRPSTHQPEEPPRCACGKVHEPCAAPPYVP